MLAGDKTQTWAQKKEREKLEKYVDVSGGKNMSFFFREMFMGEKHHRKNANEGIDPKPLEPMT